jgi:malonyl-CoA O-methyltransferase
VIDRSAVRRHFSRASTSYDASAIVQKEIASRLAERLPLLKINPTRIVDLGAGTGFLSAHIQAQYPQAQLLAVDLSEQMLRQYRHNQQANVAWWQKLNPFTSKADVHVVSADAYKLPFSDASVDMLVSSLMLQWCDDLPAVLAECRRVLKPSGVFFIASLGPDTLKEIRLAWQAVDGQAQQHLLNFADIHDLGDAVSRSGFADPVLDVERITLTYATPRAALDDLKHIGATNANKGRGAGLMGKTKWAAFLQAYQNQALPDGRIPATFEVVYAHAFAGQLPQALSDGVVSVPISQIKRWQGR